MEIKEITALNIDTSTIDRLGETRTINVVGTPGSIFSLTIKDRNDRNVLSYTNSMSKTIKTAASASSTLELNNAVGLEVGMIVINDQRRNVKISGISNPVKANVDAINETSTTYITISSHLTFAVDTSVTFAKEADITQVTIPDSGVYTFFQNFPKLEKFTRTLKTAASSAISLTLDYNDDLENDMRITGDGVDGNNPTVGLIKDSSIYNMSKTYDGVDPDGVTVRVEPVQTIADETELTFEMPDNRYDIALYPLKGTLGKDVPRGYPTYSIYQYADPIVQIIPSTSLSNVTVDGTVALTGSANTKTKGTNGDITISMTATKSDGTLIKSREPRFSSVDSEASDFSNTLNTVVKTAREDSQNKTIVHLNNVTGVRRGMIVTGKNVQTNRIVTVKDITGTTVKLSLKQPIQRDDVLTFSSMFSMRISSLVATLTDNGGLSNGVCTVTGTGKITTFGIDSFDSTFSFDNFLSI
tara:strand:- start:417 stop:1829 length:1413 start_codon:yes stop_codon:yes gene_type:complete